MAKQIGLALTQNDLRSIEAVFQIESDIVFIEDKIDPDHQSLEMLTTIMPTGASVFCFISIEDFLDRVVIRRHSERKYAIDVEASFVFELWRPVMLTSITMRPGRLYYEQTTRIDGETKMKDAAFIAWADSIFARVRRSLVRDTRTGLFVGMEAGAAMAAGRLILES